MKACRLLLFVLLFPFAVLAHTLEAVAHTPEAVAQTPEADLLTLVARLGGSVTAAAAPGSPIVAIHLHGSAVTDAGIQHLDTLLIGGTAISDGGTAALLKMPVLRKVSLFDTKVTDTGVLSLGAMQQLKVLLLGRTAVSAEAMNALLASLPDLVFTEAT